MAPQPMTLCEIGPRGAQVEIGCPLQLNRLYELRLNFGVDTVVALARVAHCGICRVEQGHVTYRAGLEFNAPGEHVALVIADFVQSAQSSQQAPRAYPEGELAPLD